MKPTFTLAAPSLYPADTVSALSVFAQVVYPCTVRLINHMPRRMTLTLLGTQENVFLEHCAGIPETTQAIVTLTCVEQLARLVSHIEQISELNRYRQAITIEALEALPDEMPVEVSATAAPVTEILSNEVPASDTVVTDTASSSRSLPDTSNQDEQVAAQPDRSAPAEDTPIADGSPATPPDTHAGAPPPATPAPSNKGKNSKGSDRPASHNQKGASP
ncbi:hypothetical protein HZU77_015040 [Neisseriaceae bacterium TC5R-5]|nr:hypothetical protein [Neisseriaceae bacterium TC5R-5]